jgi:hypothetical protein
MLSCSHDFDPCFSENKGFQSNKTGARPSARSKRVDLDLDQIWLYLMELPATKTVPPLLLLKALNGAPDLECLPLLLLLKRLGQAGGQSEAFRERFSLARLKKLMTNLTVSMAAVLVPQSPR